MASGTRAAADADHNAPVMRRGDPTDLAPFLDLSARNDWIGGRGVGKRALHLGQQWLAHQVVPERQPETVLAFRLEEIRRDGDRRIGLLGQRRRLLDRIGNDGFDRRRVIGEPVDEGGVGAVLQQPAHEVSQQIAMAADRRIDAARLAEALGPHDFAVQRLAHAVEPLKLVGAIARRAWRWPRWCGHCGWRIADRSSRAAPATPCAAAR